MKLKILKEYLKDIPSFIIYLFKNRKEDRKYMNRIDPLNLYSDTGESGDAYDIEMGRRKFDKY